MQGPLVDRFTTPVFRLRFFGMEIYNCQYAEVTTKPFLDSCSLSPTHIKYTPLRKDIQVNSEEMARKDVRHLMEKVTVDIGSADMPLWGSITTISLRDGTKYTMNAPYPLGHAKNPMSLEDVIKKFRNCAKVAAVPIPEANINEVIDMCAHLEDVSDVIEMVRLLTPSR